MITQSSDRPLISHENECVLDGCCYLLPRRQCCLLEERVVKQVNEKIAKEAQSVSPVL